VTRPAFRDLMRNVIAGAASLAQTLRDSGLKLYANGTDTHMVVVDLRRTDWHESDVNVTLEQHGLVANTTTLPRRQGDISTLGLRLGATPMSIRGLGDDGFAQAAKAVATLLAAGPRAGLDTRIAGRMRELAMTNPIPFG